MTRVACWLVLGLLVAACGSSGGEPEPSATPTATATATATAEIEEAECDAIRAEVESLDVDALTPREALEVLYRLKALARE